MLKACIYKCSLSSTEEIYHENRAELFLLADGLQIYPGQVKNSVPFKNYFLSNWENIVPMWVKAYRKDLPLQVI